MISARSIARGTIVASAIAQHAASSSEAASPAASDGAVRHLQHPPQHKSEHVTPPSLCKLPPDFYGQSHPIETEQVISEGLSLLQVELDKLVGTATTTAATSSGLDVTVDTRTTNDVDITTTDNPMAGIQRAMLNSPKNVQRKEHRLLFLRCEMFNCDLAAKRMVKYWNRRVELFGDGAYASALTLDGALRNDGNALDVGFMRLLPGTDGAGRAIMLVEARRLDADKYTRDGMVRAVWYMMHAALESQTAQQKGIIALVNMQDVSVRQFDKELISKIADSLKGCLPVRLSAIHICHPPMVFSIIFPLIKLLLGPRLRKRIRLYSKRDVPSELKAFGLTKDALPTELGGNVALDHDAWLDQRRRDGK